jgi:hypothetical protein
MPLSHNPVFLREARPRWWRRLSPQAQGGLRIRSLLVAAALALLVGWLVRFGLEAGGSARLFAPPSPGASLMLDGVQTLTWLFGGLLAVLGVVFTSSAVSRERDVRTWDHLLVTCLRPRDILLGKLFGRLAPVGILVLLTLPAWVVLVVRVIGSDAFLLRRALPLLLSPGPVSISYSAPNPVGSVLLKIGLRGTMIATGLLWAYALGLLLGLFGGCVGLFFSFRLRSTPSALIAGFGTLSLAYLMVFLPLAGSDYLPASFPGMSLRVALIPAGGSALCYWLAKYEFNVIESLRRS